MKNLKTFILTSFLAFTTTVNANSLASSDTVSFWVMNNGVGSKKALEKIIKRFQKENKIPVDVRFLNWGEAFSEISQALDLLNTSQNKTPDIVQLGSTWVPYFAHTGKIKELHSFLTQIDSTRFFKESFKAAHISNDSLVYSFPWFLDLRAFYANEKKWNSLNFKKEKIDSYAEFISFLRAYSNQNSKENTAPFALPGKDDWTGPQHIAPFIWSFGGDFLIKDSLTYRSALLDSNTLKGLNIYLKILSDNELSPFGIYENSVDNTNRFIDGNQLILFGTSELIRKIEISKKDGGLKHSPIANDGIKVIPSPSGEMGAISFIGGSHLALTQKKNKNAEKLLSYLLRADNMDAYTRQIGFLPVDKSIINIWLKDVRYLKLMKSLENGKSFPNIPEWVAVENILIEFSNSLGKLLRENSDLEKSQEFIAKKIYENHLLINDILKVQDTLSKEEAILYIKKYLFALVFEPTLQFLTEDSSQNSNHNLKIILIVALSLCVFVFILIYIKKYKQIKHK